METVLDRELCFLLLTILLDCLARFQAALSVMLDSDSWLLFLDLSSMDSSSPQLAKDALLTSLSQGRTPRLSSSSSSIDMLKNLEPILGEGMGLEGREAKMMDGTVR